MNLLISNDDGVFAPGIAALTRELARLGTLTVVAPDRDRSGASNSLTLDRPLYPRTHDNGFISIAGTPTDCVHLGIHSLSAQPPDRVVSGINAGANLGDDVLYSGTVAAAMEGRALHATPIAVSLVRQGENELHHYQTAAIIVRRLIEQADRLHLEPRTVLNVNVPDLPLDQLQGIKLTRLGHRGVSPGPTPFQDPRGRQGYWIGQMGLEQDAGPGTDFDAVRHGYVSVTPLQIDMTRYEAFDTLTRWLESLR